MRPEELIDAVGMIKDEYIEEAAPKARVTAFPGSAEDLHDEKGWRSEPRRRGGWMRYGSVAAAAALLVVFLGVTQIGGRFGKADNSADSGMEAEPQQHSQEASYDGNPNGYSVPARPDSKDDREGADTMTPAVNPMQEIDKETMAGEDGVDVVLPEGASEAVWYRYDAEPLVDEVRFVFEGREVYFRAQKVDAEIGRPLSIESFTGMYYDWDNGVQSVADNDRGGFYTAVDASEGAEVLYWYSEDGEYIFSLSVSGETLGNADECMDSLIRIYNEIKVTV